MKITNFDTNLNFITYKKLASLVLMLMTFIGFSQNSVISLSTYNNEIIVDNPSSGSISDTSTKETLLKNLMFNKQDAVYITSSTLNEYGDKPLCVYNNVNRISRLLSDNFNREFVVLINLKVNSVSDLTNLNLSDFSSFPNLKFVVFTCTIPITQNDFSQINTGGQLGIDFIYYYENPS